MYLSLSSEVYKVPLGPGAPPSSQPPVTKQPSYDDDDNTELRRPPYTDEDTANQRPSYTDENVPSNRQPYVEENIQTTQTQNDVETLPEFDTRRSPPRSISPENRAPYKERTSAKASLTDEVDSKSSKSCNRPCSTFSTF